MPPLRSERPGGRRIRAPGAAVDRAAGTTDSAGRTARPGAVPRPGGGACEGSEHGAAGVPTRPDDPPPQWEGVGRPGPRKAAETLPDRSETKLGIWYSNTKSRRDKLTAEQLDALQKLGVEWAV